MRLAGRLMHSQAGQHMVEWALAWTAAVVAASYMALYVKDSLASSVKNTEMQLNGAAADNRP